MLQLWYDFGTLSRNLRFRWPLGCPAEVGRNQKVPLRYDEAADVASDLDLRGDLRQRVREVCQLLHRPRTELLGVDRPAAGAFPGTRRDSVEQRPGQVDEVLVRRAVGLEAGVAKPWRVAIQQRGQLPVELVLLLPKQPGQLV